MGDRWLPFQDAVFPIPTIERLMEVEGHAREKAELFVNRLALCKCYLNNLYQVLVFEFEVGGEPMVHLEIKRRDKRHVHDWRDLLRIKNELVGAECEGFEIYPPESRLLDEANQYHLWVFKNPGATLGIGFGQRRVGDWDEAQKVGARQRPLPDWMKKERK